MHPDEPRHWRGWPDIDDGTGTETDRSAAHPDRLAAMPAPGALSLPTKIPKTTPCKVAWRSPACAISRKHFDTSGKSPARLHDRGICRTPMTLPDTGLFGRQSLDKWTGEEILVGLLLRAKDLKFVLAVIKPVERFLARIMTRRFRRVVEPFAKSTNSTHRDGFHDQFGHASDLVTLPVLQMTEPHEPQAGRLRARPRRGSGLTGVLAEANSGGDGAGVRVRNPHRLKSGANRSPSSYSA